MGTTEHDRLHHDCVAEDADDLYAEILEALAQVRSTFSQELCAVIHHVPRSGFRHGVPQVQAARPQGYGLYSHFVLVWCTLVLCVRHSSSRR